MFRPIKVVLALIALWPSWAWAQMESSPGGGPTVGHPYTFYGSNTVFGMYAEVPCIVRGTSGTITLNLSACNGGSPSVFHIGPLTGPTTIAFTNPTPGQSIRLEIAANTQQVIIPYCIGPTPTVPVSGNSFIIYDTFDTAPTYWCPGGVQAGLVSSATAWDLVHKNVNVTISGVGNLIATASGATADKAGYATNFHSTGKFSFAITATSVATSIGLGIGNASATTTTFCGNDGNSICYYATGSTVTNNGVGGGNTTGLPTFATGNKIWIAVHFTGTQTNLWVNKSAGAPGTSGWVGNGGTSGNPDTDTNPIVFSSSASVSPAYDLSASGDQVTADFLTPSGLATYSTW